MITSVAYNHQMNTFLMVCGSPMALMGLAGSGSIKHAAYDCHSGWRVWSTTSQATPDMLECSTCYTFILSKLVSWPRQKYTYDLWGAGKSHSKSGSAIIGSSNLTHHHVSRILEEISLLVWVWLFSVYRQHSLCFTQVPESAFLTSTFSLTWVGLHTPVRTVGTTS